MNVEVIGEKANATRPEIEQIMIANSRGLTAMLFERMLFMIRRRIENRALAESIKDFYVCSLSCRSVIYKGMFLAEQLTAFYPDLADERFTSNFAVYHQRYSTNTFPNWWLAQPFRVIAHNGEINTLKGNVNWMKAHETRMAHETLWRLHRDLKPVIQPGSSDSASLDSVFEVMTRTGRHAADGQVHVDSGGVVEREPDDAAGLARLLQLLQCRHGGLGRPRGDRRLWRCVGSRRHGPERPSSDALHADG